MGRVTRSHLGGDLVRRHSSAFEGIGQVKPDGAAGHDQLWHSPLGARDSDL